MKLTTAQSTLLRIIAATPDGVWYPRDPATVGGVYLSLDGSAVAQTSKALWRKGLAVQCKKLGPYASAITDEGRTVAEQEKGKPFTWISKVHQQPWDKLWECPVCEREYQSPRNPCAIGFCPDEIGKTVKCDTCDACEALGGEITEQTLEDDGWYISPTETLCPEHAEIDEDADDIDHTMKQPLDPKW
jgi:hypothetical protein